MQLPGLLAEIEEAAGRNAALEIAVAHGGLCKEFPTPDLLKKNSKRYAKHWLVATVGHDLALVIVEAIFPMGGRAEIPAARSVLRRIFIQENAAQMPVPEIAMFLELTERGVRRIKSELRREGIIA